MPGRGDILGFSVEALDGPIGRIDPATADTDVDQIVVDTGPWVIGRKVLLPARVITLVDLDEENVSVDRTKAEIKKAPPYRADGRRSGAAPGSFQRRRIR